MLRIIGSIQEHVAEFKVTGIYASYPDLNSSFTLQRHGQYDLQRHAKIGLQKHARNVIFRGMLECNLQRHAHQRNAPIYKLYSVSLNPVLELQRPRYMSFRGTLG